MEGYRDTVHFEIREDHMSSPGKLPESLSPKLVVGVGGFPRNNTDLTRWREFTYDSLGSQSVRFSCDIIERGRRSLVYTRK